MDSNNPFAAPGGTARASRGLIVAWSFAVIATIAATLAVMVWVRSTQALTRELEAERALVSKATAELSGVQEALRGSRNLVASLTNQVSELEKEKELAGQKAKTLEDEMREELESKDVTISKLQGRLTVTIVDRVMFDSGEAVLKPDGEAVMQKIGDLLKGHPELKVHVIGHTDNVPIRQTAQSRFASNWELSAARALAAVHFLTEKAGVDPRRLGAVGYGEFRPIADNSTAEGRAKNRRIAITVLPEEIAVADDVPLAGGIAVTNAPGSSVIEPPAR